MLFVDTLRGFDSTGVCGINKHDTGLIHKAAIDGPTFLRTEEYKDWRMEMMTSGVCAFGHNRFATKGGVTDQNAHPFYAPMEDGENYIVLVHNGTWRGTHQHIENTDVDSEAIAMLLAKTEDIEEAFKKINAAFALVWYNSKEKTLNMARNDDRPLYTARYGTCGTLFASEAATITFAAGKEDLKLSGPPELIPKNTVHSFKFDGPNITITHTKVDPPSGYVFRSYLPGTEVSNHQVSCWSEWEGQEEEQVFVNHPAGQIKYTIQEVIQSTYPDFLRTKDHSEMVLDKIKTEASHCTTRYLVDIIDCLPANDHPQCTSWFVIANLVHDDPDMEDAFIYWRLAEKSKTQMNDMLKASFRTAYLIAHRIEYHPKQIGGNNTFVCVYATDVQHVLA